MNDTHSNRLRWRIIPQNVELQEKISQEFGLSPIAAQILINRGYCEPSRIDSFLNIDLSSLFNPFSMKDMEKVVERILTASQKHERVLIISDNDVDGITSTVMLIHLFNILRIKPIYYIVSRAKGGIDGIPLEVVDTAHQMGVSLIITADWGITAFNVVEHSNTKPGLDIIITDHHEPWEDLPLKYGAYAVVNPLRKDCYYPDKNLAGCGIIFKLIQGIKSRHSMDFSLKPFLELTSIGTVADVAKLVGENRIIVKKGLAEVSRTSNPGLVALKNLLNLKSKELTSEDISFRIGPRLNAAGRLDDANLAIKLLLSKDLHEAEAFVAQLEEINLSRQAIQTKIYKEAEEIYLKNAYYKDKFIVIAKEGWHKGVIDIVASKLTEKHLYPACVISIDKDNIGYGSARYYMGFNNSYVGKDMELDHEDDFDLFHTFSRISDLHTEKEGDSRLIIQFGGHKMALGLFVEKDNIAMLRTKLNEAALIHFNGRPPARVLNIDAMLKLNNINKRLIQELYMLSPFGNGNPRPLFAVKALRVINYPKVINEKHLLLELTDNNDRFQAFGFNFGKYLEDVKRDNALVDTAFIPGTIIKNDREYIQLKIKDIRIY